MSWLVAIIVGGIVGAITSAIMKRRENYLLYIVVGILGALLARWFFGHVLGIASAVAAGTLSFLGLFWGIIGAVVLIAIVRAIMGSYGEEIGRTYSEEMRRRRRDDDKDKDDRN